MEQMRNYKKIFKDWCMNPYFDKALQDELLRITDEAEIEDRFYRDLEFGTGGLRGVMGAGTNRLNRYTVRSVTQGLANYINRQEKKGAAVAIAYDSRHNSREFAKEAALCLCANGITAYLFEGLRPTPELSFAVRKLSCMAGIVITASHNPPEYNGYKVYWEDGAQITAPRDKEIIKEVNNVTDYAAVKTMDEEKAVRGGLLHMIGKEVDDAYIQALKELVQNKEALKESAPKLNIVYTPLHGTGNIPVRRILKELGFEQVQVVEEQESPDGDFPTVNSPNPENPSAFAMALQLAKKIGADIVLATDPDADRLGIYAKDGKTGEYQAFTGNMSGLLICEYLLSEKRKSGTLPKNGAIVTTIVSGKMAAEIAKEYGVAIIETLTGFKYIGEQIKRFEETHSHEFLFGFEESYGCLIGTNSRDKDAVVAVMMLCEAAAYYLGQGMTLCGQMERLYRKYGYFKEALHTIVKKGIDGSREISRMMSALREQPPAAIGGERVLEFRDYDAGTVKNTETGEIKKSGLPKSNVLYFVLENHGWACVRPSGTEPKVKIYLGAGKDSLKKSEEALEAMWKDLSSLLS